LGDLSKLNTSGTATVLEYTGYGLYCDNVYLNGSLMTKSDSGTFAGINTTSSVKGLEEVIGNTSPIIFWAGAKNKSESEI
jgi:hypothetical protein